MEFRVNSRVRPEDLQIGRRYGYRYEPIQSAHIDDQGRVGTLVSIGPIRAGRGRFVTSYLFENVRLKNGRRFSRDTDRANEDNLHICFYNIDDEDDFDEDDDDYLHNKYHNTDDNDDAPDGKGNKTRRKNRRIKKSKRKTRGKSRRNTKRRYRK
jgi:hypothetical protein